jgi:hypothetical protein
VSSFKRRIRRGLIHALTWASILSKARLTAMVAEEAHNALFVL